MDNARIEIKYSDRFGYNAGRMAVNLPAWLEEASLPNIRGFLKLAARKGADLENHAEIIRLEAYITKAIAEAEDALRKAKRPRMVESDAALREAKAEIRRADNWLKRLRQIREALTAALDKYYPTRK